MSIGQKLLGRNHQMQRQEWLARSCWQRISSSVVLETSRFWTTKRASSNYSANLYFWIAGGFDLIVWDSSLNFRPTHFWNVQITCVFVVGGIFFLTSKIFMPDRQEGKWTWRVLKSWVFRYRDDVILSGQVGGRCDHVDSELLSGRANELSYLQSW